MLQQRSDLSYHDVCCVLLKDIGGGWWEGELANGQQGLFPEAYIEARLLQVDVLTSHNLLCLL